MQPSDEILVQGDNLSLKYTIPQFKTNTLKDTVLNRIKYGRHNKEFFALENISFKIKKGESFGIIGNNGSGKTTLLKLISGILRPDEGSIEVNGRVSALLELGAGFHPDLTGRENIYLNGSIMGLTRWKIDALFDEIVAFAEIEKFIDTPLRHFSSGMHVRLGFSIVAVLDSDILVIDEALAVGDISFQKKCIDKIEEFKENGKTIIFVSHDLRTVKRICQRVICLENGRILFHGETGNVISDYISMSRKKEKKNLESKNMRRRGLKKMEILHVDILDKDENAKEAFDTGECVIIKVYFQVNEKVVAPTFGVAILRDDGVYVFGPNTREDNVFREISFDSIGKGYFKIIYDNIHLLAGEYVLHVGIFDNNEIEVYDFVQNMNGFKINARTETNVEGIVKLAHSWEVQKE